MLPFNEFISFWLGVESGDINSRKSISQRTTDQLHHFGAVPTAKQGTSAAIMLDDRSHERGYLTIFSQWANLFELCDVRIGAAEQFEVGKFPLFRIIRKQNLTLIFQSLSICWCEISDDTENKSLEHTDAWTVRATTKLRIESRTMNNNTNSIYVTCSRMLD